MCSTRQEEHYETQHLFDTFHRTLCVQNLIHHHSIKTAKSQLPNAQINQKDKKKLDPTS